MALTEKELCVLCGKRIEGYGHNAEPLAKGTCCDSCSEKVVLARLRAGAWGNTLFQPTYQTQGINNAIEHDFKYAKEIMKCLGKYRTMNWGDTCKDDCELNNFAVYNGDERVVAKYKTSKGNIFIITESDRSATTIMFAEEY